MRATGQGDGPWDYGLAFLVDADAYPLRLGPIHRVIPHLNPAEAAAPGGAGVHRDRVAGRAWVRPRQLADALADWRTGATEPRFCWRAGTGSG